MELTLDSAFSTGGMVGHLAYVLLVASMLMRSMVWLRIVVIASALVAVLYAAVWLGDPVSLFWETMLVAVNIAQLTLTWVLNRRARFTAEEQGFVDARLPGLSRQEARRLLNLGQWQDVPQGHELTRQGAKVATLVYLTGGAARVQVDGRTVATIQPGHFVGEMSVVDGGPASATVAMAAPGRLWALPRPALDRLRADGSRLAAALELAIAHDLKAKVVLANTRDLAQQYRSGPIH